MTDHAPMRDAATVRRFVFAGDARFTLSFVSNGDPVRYTYRVRLSEGSDKWAPRFFVSLLTGPDNGSDYTSNRHTGCVLSAGDERDVVVPGVGARLIAEYAEVGSCSTTADAGDNLVGAEIR